MMPRIWGLTPPFDLCVVTRSLRDSNFHAHPVVNFILRLPQYQSAFVGDLINSIRLFPIRPWSLSPRVSPAFRGNFCHLPSHWELSQSSRPLIHLEGVKKRNATSIAFVVDQLSPDTISLSLQDEAHQRLLQQPPVRSFILFISD